jgi:hypothetical protein
MQADGWPPYRRSYDERPFGMKAGIRPGYKSQPRRGLARTHAIASAVSAAAAAAPLAPVSSRVTPFEPSESCTRSSRPPLVLAPGGNSPEQGGSSGRRLPWPPG